MLNTGKFINSKRKLNRAKAFYTDSRLIVKLLKPKSINELEHDQCGK